MSLLELLARITPRGVDEHLVQEQISLVLAKEGFSHYREVRLSKRDRIDFLIEPDKIGIEVKTQGTVDAVYAQLLRYAQSPRIEELILYTTRSQLRPMPKTLAGKRVYVVVGYPGVW